MRFVLGLGQCDISNMSSFFFTLEIVRLRELQNVVHTIFALVIMLKSWRRGKDRNRSSLAWDRISQKVAPA